MRYHPSFEEFTKLAQGVSLVPVYRQLIGDTLTPVSAFCKIQEGDWSFLFESVIGGERLGRYASSAPGRSCASRRSATEFASTPERGKTEEFEHPDPLRLLEEKLAAYRAPHVPGLPRFCGGAVGYAGYDTVRYVEHLPNPPADDRQLPDLCFAFYDRMVIFDHINKTIAAVAHAHVDPANLGPELRRRLPARRSAGGTAPAGRGRFAADRHRAGRRSPAALSLQLRAGRSTRRPSRSARNTSRPATFSRWSSASGSRPRPRPGRSTSTARCASSIPARSCST